MVTFPFGSWHISDPPFNIIGEKCGDGKCLSEATTATVAPWTEWGVYKYTEKSPDAPKTTKTQGSAKSHRTVGHPLAFGRLGIGRIESSSGDNM